MLRKVIKIIATVLCFVLIIDGIIKVFVTGTNGWGLIIVGVFFLIAVGPDAFDGLKK